MTCNSRLSALVNEYALIERNIATIAELRGFIAEHLEMCRYLIGYGDAEIPLSDEALRLLVFRTGAIVGAVRNTGDGRCGEYELTLSQLMHYNRLECEDLSNPHDLHNSIMRDFALLKEKG